MKDPGITWRELLTPAAWKEFREIAMVTHAKYEAVREHLRWRYIKQNFYTDWWTDYDKKEYQEYEQTIATAMRNLLANPLNRSEIAEQLDYEVLASIVGYERELNN